ncbi:hypothetical protein IP91_02967 [Pseudoduganella lurida]|uniref:Cytochrome-c oxidase n=1 Tax=Pseudoduganella lurida TaxID=1036180 RepID=A0A562R571_9BURK|nr:cbb3-type cytochrome c oxidase subunit I [Pseudoduganella lurida]TWI64201.1 hypothetical protein IP91_02967 [Pseudoduganella lurida]
MRTLYPGARDKARSAGILWIKLAVLYLIIGVGMGIAMGATENFTLRPVHAHVNLLGWTTLALSGLIYTVFPAAGTTRLARIHFWLLNLAIPVMMGSLACLLLKGDTRVLPALVASEIVAAASILAFAANIFLNLHGEGRQYPRQYDLAAAARMV